VNISITQSSVLVSPTLLASPFKIIEAALLAVISKVVAAVDLKC